jgi:hypothetical protein
MVTVMPMMIRAAVASSGNSLLASQGTVLPAKIGHDVRHGHEWILRVRGGAVASKTLEATEGIATIVDTPARESVRSAEGVRDLSNLDTLQESPASGGAWGCRQRDSTLSTPTWPLPASDRSGPVSTSSPRRPTCLRSARSQRCRRSELGVCGRSAARSDDNRVAHGTLRNERVRVEESTGPSRCAEIPCRRAEYPQ